MEGKSQAQYIREHNLQYIFAEAGKRVQAFRSFGSNSNTKSMSDEELIKKAFSEIKSEIENNEQMLKMGRKVQIKASSAFESQLDTELTIESKKQGTEWTADITHNAKNGSIKATIELNKSNLSEIRSFLIRFAPYVSGVQTRFISSGPRIQLTCDSTPVGIDCSDGCAGRLLAALIDYLREVRQELHVKRMYAPL